MANYQDGTAVAKVLIDLLFNQFTDCDQVFEHLCFQVYEKLSGKLQNLPNIKTEDHKINWQGIFESIGQIKANYNEREKVRGVFKQLMTVSDAFGFSGPWFI